MEISITKHGSGTIPGLIDKYIRSGHKNIVLLFPDCDDLNILPMMSSIIPLLMSALEHEDKAEITIRDIPFCLMKNAEDHVHNNGSAEKKVRPDSCRGCIHKKICAGIWKNYAEIYGTGELSPVPDLPKEVVIEVTGMCNLDCSFCFNKASGIKNGKDKMDTRMIKKIIDSTADAGIPAIRFTGGEPLLRQDIFELMAYAKDKGLEVRLNTNGILIDKETVAKLECCVSNVLVAVNSYDALHDDMTTGTDGSHKKRLEAIRLLRDSRIPVVRCGTIATPENIKNLEKIHSIIIGLGVEDWELYRPVATDRSSQTLTRYDLNMLLEKLKAIKETTGKVVPVANAIPFCAADDIDAMAAFSLGAEFDDGHSRAVIDPRGFAKPSYFLNENIGDPTDIIKCWNHPFMKKMRNLELVPEECTVCLFLRKCRGASRYAANLALGDYCKKDPLMEKPLNKNRRKALADGK